MAGFSLLSVLGNGSGRTAGHHRFPIAAYQSGSVLVLWDYVRSGGETRKFVLLQPNQRCTSLFFSRDSQHVLGLWASQTGQPTLTVWQVSDGAKIAEQRLSDQSGGSEIWADFHSESSHLLLAHGAPVLSASVVCWSERGPRLQPVAHGPLGGVGPLAGLRLLDEGRHFATCEAAAVVFWAFMERAPRQALRVDLNKPVRAFEVHAGLVYLLPERGRLQVMNFEGHKEPQRAVGPPAGLAFTAVAVRGPLVCLGLDDGALQLYASAPAGELWRHVPFPTDSPGVPSQPVVSVTFGMNDDYVCVAFADATHGVVHLDSGRYVALRVGHSGAVRSFVMAPRLRVPPGLASSMPDSEGFALARTLSFLTLAGDPTWVTWPRSGAPVRAALRSPPKAPPAVPPRESYAPRGAADQADAPLVMSAAAFHPEARLVGDGGLAGAYQLLAGAADGSLHALESEDGRGAAAGGPPRDVAWRAVRVRPPPLELELGGAGGGGERAPAAVCHLAFSRCGQYAAASFRGGLAEMLHFPGLARALVLQAPQQAPRRGPGPAAGGGQETVHAKAFFVWRPGDPSRAYDRNIYIVSHAASARELVLYEVYGLGDVWAKSSRAEFVLPAVCQAAGGEITDFAAHPSQLYLVVAAVLPAADTRSVALVFDMWSGELLSSCALFGSALTTPLLPLRPSLCVDPSGAFLFCASSPTAIGALGVSGQPEQAPEGGTASVVTDSLFARGPGAAGLQDAHGADQTASVVCIIDFRTGQQTYQSTVEVSCLAIGSLAHDPTQLLLGAHDGSVSVWHPPEAVSSRIRGLLDDSRELGLAERRRLGEVPGPLLPPELEEAVAAHWAAQAGRLDWQGWGDGGQRRAPPRPPPPPALPPPRAEARGAARQGEEADDDVVVLARRRWPPLAPAAASWPPLGGAADSEGWCPRQAAREAPRSWPPPEPLPRDRALFGRSAGWPPREASPPARGAAAPPPRAGAEASGPRARALALEGPRPERDEVSGLEVGELPGGAEELGRTLAPRGGPVGPRGGALAARPPEPAELLVAAPEFHEEFGTSHEHFGDQAPTPTGGAWQAALGLKSGPGACGVHGAVGGGLRAARHLGVLRAVLSEIDRFELEHPDSRALESPRSARGEAREHAGAALSGAAPCAA